MTQLFPESGGRIRSGLRERHLLQGPGLCFVLVAIFADHAVIFGCVPWVGFSDAGG